MFDFRHPNNKQVLLNSDGSVKSTRHISGHVATVSEKAVDAQQYTGGELALSADGSGGSVPTGAVAGGAAAVALVAAGAGVAVLRRRRAHAGSTH